MVCSLLTVLGNHTDMASLSAKRSHSGQWTPCSGCEVREVRGIPVHFQGGCAQLKVPVVRGELLQVEKPGFFALFLFFLKIKLFK